MSELEVIESSGVSGKEGTAPLLEKGKKSKEKKEKKDKAVEVNGFQKVEGEAATGDANAPKAGADIASVANGEPKTESRAVKKAREKAEKLVRRLSILSKHDLTAGNRHGLSSQLLLCGILRLTPPGQIRHSPSCPTRP
jgi:hypothetical protein